MTTDAFAYCFDDELLQTVLRDWPDGLHLLLCLRSDGGCCTLIYHKDETARALRRGAAMMGLRPNSFPVSPEVRGWPTRAVRFSEEQDLLNLAVGSADLVAMARAYLEEREAATDEGAEVGQGGEAAAAAEEAPSAPRRRLNLALARADVMERIRAKTAAAGVAMPPGFLPSGAQSGCRFGSGYIGLSGGHVRVILGAGKVTIHTTPFRIAEIGISSDFRRIYVPRAALGAWEPGQLAVIDIPLDVFPEALSDLFAAGLHHADVAITAEGLFIAPGRVVNMEESAAPEPEAQPAARPRRRLWRVPLRAAAACLAAGTATAAAVGMVPASQPHAQPGGHLERPARPGGLP